MIACHLVQASKKARKRKKRFLNFYFFLHTLLSRAHPSRFHFHCWQKPRSGCAFFDNGRVIAENR
jgi:hypothetical protein